MKSWIIASIFVLASAHGVLAQASNPPPIQVEHAWARATAGKTGGAFMTIVNTGSADDRLISVATPIAEKAEVHRTIEENGVMKMRPVPEIDVKAGDKAVLQPGGYHVMLMGLATPLKQGTSFPLTLTFVKAGNVTTNVTVQKAGASAPDAMSGHAMPGHAMSGHM
jgi:copper(I)-binding protein